VLDGVLYTAIFNPADGRKLWRDMLRCFCIALREHDDATLVLKLTQGGWSRTRTAMTRELFHSSPFAGRVVLVDGFLDETEYAALLKRSTYALNVSSGEGQCLPLMEYMSAGKPAVAPRHTGMQDYVDEGDAFLVETSLEPCAWPQDPRPRYRTFRHRIDAESLMRAFRESYRVAKDEPERYAQMSSRAAEALRRHCSQAVVEARLRAVLTRAAAAAPSRESSEHEVRR
jgi:glycosyltransferase involved in cell wall biosynthesis